MSDSPGVGGTGTTISFLPDPEIFEEIELSAQVIVQRLRETAFLTRGLRIAITDERAGGERVEFHYEGGIKDFVAYTNESKDTVHKHIFYTENETEAGIAEVAMQWNTSYQESIFSFANNINTREGGTHMQGFRSALTRTLNKYARDKGLLKEKDENLEGRGRARGSRRRHLREACRTRSSRARRRASSATRRSPASSRRRSTRG